MAKQPNPDPLFTLRGDMSAIHNLLFHLKGDSEFLYASTQTGVVHKWNLQTCREEFRIEVSKEPCLGVKCFKECFISQEKGGGIKLWDESEETWKLITKINTDYWGFCKFDIYREKFLVCPESGSKINIINIEDKTCCCTLCLTTEDNECGEIMALKCISLFEVTYILVLCESGQLSLFQTSGCKVSDLKITSDCPMALDFDKESKGLVGSSGDTIFGFELTSDLKLITWKKVVITNAGVSSITIRPDKKLFAAGCWDATVRLFSMKTFKLLAALQCHKETVQDVCFSPIKVKAWDTQWILAVAGKDGRITLWNLY